MDVYARARTPWSRRVLGCLQAFRMLPAGLTFCFWDSHGEAVLGCAPRLLHSAAWSWLGAVAGTSFDVRLRDVLRMTFCAPAPPNNGHRVPATPTGRSSPPTPF